MNYKNTVIIAAICGGLAVILGAFGAHALETRLTADQLASYGTANDYQFYHSLLLLAIGVFLRFEDQKLLRLSAWFAVLGMIFFSGSIYLLACKDILGLTKTGFLGPITPFGGLFFILSWTFLLISVLKQHK